MISQIYFDYNINLMPAVLLGAQLVAAVGAVTPVAVRASRLSRLVKLHNAQAMVAALGPIDKTADSGRPYVGDELQEPVSVVVRAADDATHLAQLLPQILEQDFEPGFEVIVVNEGACHAVEEVVDSLRMQHPNLYYTFTPDHARHLSCKKLALMLGVKAARNRVVVHTTANAAIDSRRWLARITRHFTDPAVRVVVGYADITSADNAGMCRRARAFDVAAQAAAWLVAANDGHVYRASRHCLAYTTEAFFQQKGFSKTLHLVNGDDDIFIADMAAGYPDSVVVELSNDARVNCNFYKPAQAVRDDLTEHRFTGRRVWRGAQRIMIASSLAYSAMWILAVVAAVIAWPNAAVSVTALTVALVATLWGTLSWSRIVRLLTQRRMFWTLPRLWATQPLRNALTDLRVLRSRRRHYT